jgi:hypothetical protein
MKKDLLSIYDLELDDIGIIFEKSQWLKKILMAGQSYTPLKGKSLGMIFDENEDLLRGGHVPDGRNSAVSEQQGHPDRQRGGHR